MSMTLEHEIDEFMNYSRSIAEIAKSDEDEANRMSAEYFADYCKQIAEWLKELKVVKDIIKQHDDDSMPEDFWYIDKIREAVQK